MLPCQDIAFLQCDEGILRYGWVIGLQQLDQVEVIP